MCELLNKLQQIHSNLLFIHDRNLYKHRENKKKTKSDGVSGR